jgi:hypothetical protein
MKNQNDTRRFCAACSSWYDTVTCFEKHMRGECAPLTRDDLNRLIIRIDALEVELKRMIS